MAIGGGPTAAPAREGLQLSLAAADLYGDLRLAPLLRRLLAHSDRLLGVVAGSISLLDASRQSYRKMAEHGVSCELGQSFPLDEGLTGQVVARRGPVVLRRYSAVPGGHLALGHPARDGAAAAVPLWWRGEVVGANVVFAGRERRFTAGEIDELELLTQVGAAGIVKAGEGDPSLAGLLRGHHRADDVSAAGRAVVTETGSARPLPPTLAGVAVDLVTLADRAAVRRAGARLRVAVVHQPGGVRLLLHDEAGGGTAEDPLGAAVATWQELVAGAGGDVTIEQVPGWGTLLRADLPYEPVATRDEAPASPFTPRERETIGLLALGLSDRQVAAHLVLSRKTVEKHVGAVLRKTGARNRTGAVMAAVARGWLPA